MDEGDEEKSLSRGSDVTEATTRVLREVASIVSGAGARQDGRIFFPDGIDFISITAKFGGAELALVVSGPKSRPAETPSPTFEAIMLAPAATGFIPLPRGTGDYNTYAAADRQYGTSKTIATVTDVAQAVHQTDATLTFSVGDISFEDGSVMPPHGAHRLGRNIDIRPIRKDRQDKPVSYRTTAEYDRAATNTIIQEFLAHANVTKVIFNDKSIAGVTTDPTGTTTHDNHFHVEIKA